MTLAGTLGPDRGSLPVPAAAAVRRGAVSSEQRTSGPSRVLVAESYSFQGRSMRYTSRYLAFQLATSASVQDGQVLPSSYPRLGRG